MAPIEFPRTIEINFNRLTKLKSNIKNGKSAMQCLNPHNINIMIEKTVIILPTIAKCLVSTDFHFTIVT